MSLIATIPAPFWSRKRILAGLFLGLAVFTWTGPLRRWQRMRAGAEIKPEEVAAAATPARWDGTYPCVFASAVGANIAPSLGRCATPTIHSASVDSFEVDLRYGAFNLRQTDLRLDDGFEVPLTRTYDSRVWLPHNHVQAFGLNSNHPYDIAPLGTSNPYTHMELALEDGDLLYFKRISKGVGYADAVFMHTDTSTRFYKATIAWNGDGWTARLADGSKVVFPESYKAPSLAYGAATKMFDPAGNKLELQRDPQRNLREILTAHGHWIKFTFDERARVTLAEDDHGNSVRYGYNAQELLMYAIKSSGEERHYEYDGHLMTAIGDEHAHTLLRNTYVYGVIVRQDYANGDVYKYAYQYSPRRTYVLKASVTFPDGSVQNVSIGDTMPINVREQ